MPRRRVQVRRPRVWWRRARWPRPPTWPGATRCSRPTRASASGRTASAATAWTTWWAPIWPCAWQRCENWRSPASGWYWCVPARRADPRRTCPWRSPRPARTRRRPRRRPASLAWRWTWTRAPCPWGRPAAWWPSCATERRRSSAWSGRCASSPRRRPRASACRCHSRCCTPTPRQTCPSPWRWACRCPRALCTTPRRRACWMPPARRCRPRSRYPGDGTAAGAFAGWECVSSPPTERAGRRAATSWSTAVPFAGPRCRRRCRWPRATMPWRSPPGRCASSFPARTAASSRRSSWT